MIKFYDLNKQDKLISNKIYLNIKKVIKNKNFINGAEINEFEKKFSNYLNIKYSVACSNGTDALTIALKSLNLSKGSEVIIPGMTYISTCFAVINSGLKPVLVDVDYNTGLMDFDNLIKKITKKTKVIMPVHLYGNVFDTKKLQKKIKRKIYIIEDCSQSHGAISNNKKRVGSFSDISCFSLYPGKNLGAYGDAGIICTNSKKLSLNMRKMVNLGLDINSKFNHEIVGCNNRMDTLQAAILKEKINILDKNNNKRKKIAEIYQKKILNKKIRLIKYAEGSVYHQFIVLTNNRKFFQKYMMKNNIQTAIHYPKSINQHKSLKKLFKKISLPNSERLAKNCVSIPIDPYLNKKEILKIVEVINRF